ncbi:MAG TPA: GNAT family N-acetyltransferase [Acidimicrobiales bacterium]|nr:GNAT family N-acetyltransferase [Acidimicrobiales bacterium]
MHEPQPIITANLSLEPLRPETLAAVLAGNKDAAEVAQGRQLPGVYVESLEPRFAEIQLKRMTDRPSQRGWCARLVVMNDDDLVIGDCGFHGPPMDVGRAEIGYKILEAYRGRGYATEAVRGLVDWAKSQGARAVYASVSPDNGSSLAVVNKVGFRRVGTQRDDVDSKEIVFELKL